MSLLERLARHRPLSAAAGPLAPIDGGVLRNVLDFRIRPSIFRPSILGGALDHVCLPTSVEMAAGLGFITGSATPQPIVAIDCEATGLLGSAGVVPFLVGVAYHYDELTLRVEQWCLRTLSGEPEMLSAIADRLASLGPSHTLLSFNGSGFDLPLLRSRFGRHGIDWSEPWRHVDLLPVARRLWRNSVRDCRLGTLEHERLGVSRIADVPSHAIPAVFWAWLNDPTSPSAVAAMTRVRVHNIADLVMLPALATHLVEDLQAPRDLQAALCAARHMLATGRDAQALLVLEGALEHADTWCSPADTLRSAISVACRLLRRRGRIDRTAAWLRSLCQALPGDPWAHEALAKELEHRLGRPAEALEVASRSSRPCERRLSRLQRKVVSQCKASGQPPFRA